MPRAATGLRRGHDRCRIASQPSVRRVYYPCSMVVFNRNRGSYFRPGAARRAAGAGTEEDAARMGRACLAQRSLA